MNGNPITHTDPDGDVLPAIIAAALVGAAVSGGTTVAANLMTGNKAFHGFGRALAIGALGGAVSGGVGSLFAGTAFGQSASIGIVKSFASTAATSVAFNQEFTAATALGALAGGFVNAKLPGFTGVKGGPFANVLAETAHSAVTSGIAGAASGGVTALVSGGNVGRGISNGAKNGAIGGAAYSLSTNFWFGSTYIPEAGNGGEGQVYRRGNPIISSMGLGGGFTGGRSLLVNRLAGKNSELYRKYGESHETAHYYQMRELGLGKFYWKLGREFFMENPYGTPGTFENQADHFAYRRLGYHFIPGIGPVAAQPRR